MNRPEPHAVEHHQSTRVRGDRVSYQPRGLRALLRWASHEWSLEAPTRLHDRDVADDGAPDFTPEAKRTLGMTGSDTKPDDWRSVACRTDPDGYRSTPLHCVVAGFPDRQRMYLRDLLTDLYTPDAIAELHGLPSWAHESVARDLLAECWKRYSMTPMPRRSKSEAQLDAEAA